MPFGGKDRANGFGVFQPHRVKQFVDDGQRFFVRIVFTDGLRLLVQGV